jgi:EmrB/QacA subfamily drug resistance transporter
MPLDSQPSAGTHPPVSTIDPVAPATRSGLILTVLSLAAFMASLDLFIVNVAFDDIRHSFTGATLTDLSWVLNGYAILYAALLVPLGRLADRFGHKAGFLLGLIVFTLASVACAASPGLWWLVGFRGLQAVGAAALTPTSLGLLLTATPAAGRARAVRIWAATGALAAAAGPVVGGLLVSASWRWVFLVNLPIGLVTLVGAWRLVPNSRDRTVTGLPDLLGAGLLAIAIGSLALALVKGPDWGWASISTLGGFAASAIAGALFWLRSSRHPLPVIEPSLLRVRAFAWANLTTVIFSVAFAMNLLASILWMQQIWGYSALRTGLAIAPGPLMVPVFAAVAQSVAHRVPVGRIAAVGNAITAISAVILVFSLGAEPAYATEFLPAWVFGGAGVGLALPTLLSAATADLPADRAATGSAVVNMSRQLGSVLGISALVILLGSPTTFHQAHAGFRHAWWFAAICLTIAVPAALGMTPRLTSRSTAGDQQNEQAGQPISQPG